VKTTAIHIDTTPGSIYVYRFNGLRYRIVRAAREPKTMRWVICYDGVDGFDSGNSYVCTLSDFALRFDPVVKPYPAAAEPEKAIAHVGGSGF